MSLFSSEEEDSLLESQRPSCRICGSKDSTNKSLIRPCDCSGSIAHIHRACLEKWILLRPGETSYGIDSSRLHCELCRVKYRVQLIEKKRISCRRVLSCTTCFFTCEIAILIAIAFMLILFLPGVALLPKTSSAPGGIPNASDIPASVTVTLLLFILLILVFLCKQLVSEWFVRHWTIQSPSYATVSEDAIAGDADVYVQISGQEA